jgi:hypothetical protein
MSLVHFFLRKTGAKGLPKVTDSKCLTYFLLCFENSFSIKIIAEYFINFFIMPLTNSAIVIKLTGCAN